MVLIPQTLKILLPMSSHNFITNRGSHRSHTWNTIRAILLLLSFPTNIVAPCLFPTTAGSSPDSPLTQIDGLTEDSDSLTGEDCVRVQEESGKERGEHSHVAVSVMTAKR